MLRAPLTTRKKKPALSQAPRSLSKKTKQYVCSVPKLLLALLLTVISIFTWGITTLNKRHRETPSLPYVRKEEHITNVEPVFEEKENDYYLVFSTDCSEYQHWQSYLLFRSALNVGQPGQVIRIASGCNEDESVAATEWHDKYIRTGMSERFGLHLTPHFTSIKAEDGSDTGKHYEFFNKPFGLLHWFENRDYIQTDVGAGTTELDENAVVILIDPDMVLLRPIEIDYSNDKEVIVNGRYKDSRKHRVEPGSPFASTYGFGAQWTNLDLAQIAGDDSPALRVTQEDAAKNYAVGPPYIGFAGDMYRIAVKWAEFVPQVHVQYPHLLAEMFAYSIAAAHLELPHQLLQSLMVSDSTAGNKEAWPFVDVIPAEEVCEFACNMDHSKHPLPNVIHHCQRYMVGDWFFGKRRLPKNFFSCESPLLAVPPMDIALKYDYQMPPPPHEPPGEKKPMSSVKANRETFLLCGMISMLNEAGEYFKKKHCDGVEGTRRDKSMELRKVPP